MGCLKTIAKLAIGGVILVVLLVVLMPKPDPNRPAVAPPATPPATSSAAPIVAAAPSAGLPPAVPSSAPPSAADPLEGTEVRAKMIDAESESDVIGGLNQAKRREIYGAQLKIGLNASRAAEARYPLSNLPTDQSALEKHLAAHKQIYESMKKKGRVALVKQYKVDGATLDRIDAEGAAKKWPAEPQTSR